MSDLDKLDCEALLDLLRIKSRALRRINEQVDEIQKRIQDLSNEKYEVEQEVTSVLFWLKLKAADQDERDANPSD
jgi:hypothetical protein